MTLLWPASEAEAVSLAFSLDGRTLAATDGSKVQLWDAIDGHELPSPPSEEFAFKSVAFSPNGQTLVLGGHNIRFWEVANGRYLCMWVNETLDQPGAGNAINLNIFPRNPFHVYLTVARNK